MRRTATALVFVVLLGAGCDRGGEPEGTDSSEPVAAASSATPSEEPTHTASATATASASAGSGSAAVDALFVPLPAPDEYGELPAGVAEQADSMESDPAVEEAGARAVYADGAQVAVVLAATFVPGVDDEIQQQFVEGFERGSGLTLEPFELDGQEAFHADQDGAQFIVLLSDEFLLIGIGQVGDRAEIEAVVAALAAGQ